MSDDTETPITKNRMILSSENFDICRLCLFEPESDLNIRFYQIFGSVNDFDISETLSEFLGLVVSEYNMINNELKLFFN